jgi:hypothetical protein
MILVVLFYHILWETHTKGGGEPDAIEEPQPEEDQSSYENNDN